MRNFMKKELCLVISKLSVGGAQRRAFNLANELSRNGYSVYVLALATDDSVPEINNYYSTEKNVTLISIPEYYEKNKSQKKSVEIKRIADASLFFLKLLQHFLNVFRVNSENLDFLIKCIRKSVALKSFFVNHSKATIISFEFDIFERVYFSAKNLKNRIIYAETNSSKRYESNRFYKQTKKYINKADAWVFQTKEERAEHNMENAENAFVINNPVKPNLPEAHKKNRKQIVVNFCRLSRQKNLLLLIKSFEKFLADYPGFLLEIYADCSGYSDDTYKDEILNYIHDNHLEDFVKILPAVSDIHNRILDYAMFVSSSDFEGISNSMIEAMAIGLPCICTDCFGGGAKEIITNGENGLLVPINDIDALKNAMVRMITEEGLAEKCSKNATKIKETHSTEKISKKWLEVIKNVNGD